jgi:hypothetical protein
VFVGDAIDSGSKVCNRAEHAMFQATLDEWGEEAFYGVEP